MTDPERDTDGDPAETEEAAKEVLFAGIALSPREWDVLALIAAGMSNKEIAAQLVSKRNGHSFVETSTVSKHVSRLLQKLRPLGITTRTQAAVFVVKHGLTEKRPPED
jgi:DNA-binding NarL/FixJ family response regulator